MRGSALPIDSFVVKSLKNSVLSNSFAGFNNIIKFKKINNLKHLFYFNLLLSEVG